MPESRNHATYTIDLCRELMGEDFWSEVSEQQLVISAYACSDNPCAFEEAKATARHDINETMGIDPDTQDVLVHIVGHTYCRPVGSAKPEDLGLCGVIGSMLGATVLNAPGNAETDSRPQLAIEVADPGDTKHRYFVPLERSAIAAMVLEANIDVQFPMFENSGAFLQREAERFTTIVNTPAFFASSQKKQHRVVDKMLSSMNEVTEPYNRSDYDVSVYCTQYRAINYAESSTSESSPLPADIEDIELIGTKLRIVLPEYTGEDCSFSQPEDFYISGGTPQIELLDPLNDCAYLIPLRAITGIACCESVTVVHNEGKPAPEDDAITEMNLMTEVFLTAEFQSALEYAETQALCVDAEDEELRFAELCDEEVSEQIPADLLYKPCRVKGTVFRFTNEAETTYKALAIDAKDVTLYGAQIVKLDGVPRVIIRLGITDETSGKEMIVFFRPKSSEGLAIFSYDDDNFTRAGELPSYDLMDALDVARKTCHAIIQSSDFRSSSRDQQIDLLEPAITQLNELLQCLRPAREGDTIVCTAKQFYAVPLEFAAIDTMEDLQLFEVAWSSKNQPPTMPSGERIYVDIPELHSERYATLNGLRSFPISRGEPLIMIENKKKNIIYLIRSSAIVSFGDSSAIEDDE